MAETTGISWCDSTFNPFIGCTKVSPGCDHCYAEALMDKRWHKVQWGAGQQRQRTSAANWKQPLKWEREAAAFMAEHGRRRRVFCASLADVFDNEVAPEWRADLFALIASTPNLDWLILTKRVGNVTKLLADIGVAQLPANVWMGASIVNQEEFDRDIGKLDKVDASVRFLSVEPMLGQIVDREGWLWGTGGKNGIDWVICGGESGPSARPMHPEWAASLRNQCKDTGVQFLFKQWGEWMPESAMTHAQRMRDCGQYECLFVKLDGRTHWVDEKDHEPFDSSDIRMVKVGTKATGCLLDGIEHKAWPA